MKEAGGEVEVVVVVMMVMAVNVEQKKSLECGTDS